MVGAILKATNSSFQKGATFCRCMFVNKVMKLLAFIFEQPSYCKQYGARSDCSLRSSLIRVHSVCFHDKTSLKCSRCNKQMTFSNKL